MLLRTYLEKKFKEIATQVVRGVGQAQGSRYESNGGYGRTFYVCNVNGSDSYDGYSKGWDRAFATITAAITASNAYRALTANAQKRTAIYISGGVYSETVTALPSRCDIIGIGTALTGNWTVPEAGRAAGCHLHGLYWSKAGATSVISFVQCASLEIDTCQLYATTSNVIGMEFTGCSKTYIHNCHIFGNLNVATGIKFTSGSCYGIRVFDNHIYAKTVGIHVGTNCQCQTGQIMRNNMANKDANGGGQLDLGIKVDGNYPPMVIENNISAVDAISMNPGLLDDLLNNITNEGGTYGCEALYTP